MRISLKCRLTVRQCRPGGAARWLLAMVVVPPRARATSYFLASNALRAVTRRRAALALVAAPGGRWRQRELTEQARRWTAAAAIIMYGCMQRATHTLQRMRNEAVVPSMVCSATHTMRSIQRASARRAAVGW
jgi:hypothetical protein